MPHNQPHHHPQTPRPSDRRSIPAILTIAAVGVLPLLRQPIVGLTGAALEAVAAAPDVITAISALLQVGWGPSGRVESAPSGGPCRKASARPRCDIRHAFPTHSVLPKRRAAAPSARRATHQPTHPQTNQPRNAPAGGHVSHGARHPPGRRDAPGAAARRPQSRRGAALRVRPRGWVTGGATPAPRRMPHCRLKRFPASQAVLCSAASTPIFLLHQVRPLIQTHVAPPLPPPPDAAVQRRSSLGARKSCTSAEQPDNLIVRYMGMEGSFLSQAVGAAAPARVVAWALSPPRFVGGVAS